MCGGEGKSSLLFCTIERDRRSETSDRVTRFRERFASMVDAEVQVKGGSGFVRIASPLGTSRRPTGSERCG